MNFKELTEYIAEEEGLKEQVNIAQIKEVTKIVLKVLARMPMARATKLLGRYQEDGE